MDQSIDFAGANTGPIDPETERIFSEWRAAYIWEMERAKEARGWTGKEFYDFYRDGTVPERDRDRAQQRKPNWTDKEFRDYFWHNAVPEESERKNVTRLE